jgi:Bacterial pre-peptidase C-terminal domain
MRLSWQCGLLLCALGYGCSDGERASRPDAGPTFGQPLPGSGEITRDGPGIRIGDQSSPIPGTESVPDDGTVPGHWGNHAFATALPIEPDAPPRIANEFRADQVDFYAFQGKAGAYYELSTEYGPYHPDNVITLFDAQRQPIATNDDGSIWPGDEIDARLVVRLPSDGTYYVKVEDLVTPADHFDDAFSLLFYHLTLRSVTASTPGFAFWDGSTPVADYLIDAQSGHRYLTVLGNFDAPSKGFTFAGAADTALIAQLLPGGPAGNGSTVSRGRASVRDSAGLLLADIDRSVNSGYIRPPIGEGAQQFIVEREGDAGSNAFFAVDLVLLKDNRREQREPENNTPLGAESLTWSQGTRGRSLLLSLLPAGDVDYFAVPVDAGGYIGVICEAQTTGSGVRGLSAELRDANDEPIADSADVGRGLELSSIVGPAGTYYVRLSSAATVAAQPWVRCAIVSG